MGLAGFCFPLLARVLRSHVTFGVWPPGTDFPRPLAFRGDLPIVVLYHTLIIPYKILYRKRIPGEYMDVKRCIVVFFWSYTHSYSKLCIVMNSMSCGFLLTIAEYSSKFMCPGKLV